MINYPPPPVAVPAGQYVVWATAGSNVNTIGDSGTNTLVSTLTSANFTQNASASLGSTYAYVTWSDFTANIPAGSTIQNIYPTAVYDCTNCDHVFVTVGWEVFGSPGTVASNQIYTTSIGSSYSDITSYTTHGEQDATINFDPFPSIEYFNITFYGLAVYVTIPEHWLKPSRVNVNIGNTHPYPTK